MDYLSETSTHYIDAPPLSVTEIAEKAIFFDYNPLVALRYWLRTAETLLKEAIIYQDEGNEQRAYLLLLRQAELQINYLPKHPDAKRPEYARSLVRSRQCLNEALKRLQYLKPRIAANYERYNTQKRAYEESRARRPSSSTSTKSSRSTATPYTTAAAQSLSYSSNPKRVSVPKPLDLSRGRRGSLSSGPFSPPLEKAQSSPGLNNGNKAALALEIAKQEFERREHEKRVRRRQMAMEQGRSVPIDSRGREIRRISTPSIPTTDQIYRPGQQPNTVERYSGDSAYGSVYEHGGRDGYYRWETEEERVRWERERQEEEFDLARSIEQLQIRSELTDRQMRPQSTAQRDSMRFSNANYGDWDQGFQTNHEKDKREREKHVGNWQGSYPTIPKRKESPVWPKNPPPVLKPTHDEHSIRSVTPTLPPKPTYYNIDHSAQSAGMMLPPALPTKIPEPLKPANKVDNAFKFTTPATLENGAALRTIFLPSALRKEFLTVAEPNTRKKLETCGILCGTLIQNALFISRLVIPEQEATTDTCGTTDEEGLFQYCDSEELMVLGWIHTHPTQTCFMSSVDLHTHCSYQLMLPESIAIVCAPRHEPSWGVFRLTDPPGVKTIMNCQQKGLFHPHGEMFVYTDAMRPGHVCEVREMGFDVVDLRKSPQY